MIIRLVLEKIRQLGRRVTKTAFPSGYIETYGYDADNNLTSKTNRKNQLLTYTYDQLNRLAGKTYPDNSTVNYTYDLNSRLTQVSDPTGTYQFTFDNMGRLTSASTNYAFLTSRSFTTSYGYDAASNRTSFTDPENGATAYAYDTLNRLQTLTPPGAFTTGNFGFSYDALSRRTSLTRPNAVNTTYSYDNLSRLLSVLHQAGGVTIDGASYTVDNAGNRTSKTQQPAGPATNYSYDSIYQLLSATQGANTTESYTYDPVGNRLNSLGVSSYTNNSSNELTSTPNASYGYDGNGNMLTKTDSTGTTNYTWDFENRLTSVTLPGSGGTVTFKYDPLGRRIYKSSSSGTSIYAYDGNSLVEETNAAGTAVARYSLGINIDEPLAMLRSASTSYYNADGLGSITSLSNAAGALAQTYTYDAFGKLTASSGSLMNSSQYTGREFDSETGLYYYRARYYDPNTGRFISEDPSDYNADDNFYEYVESNPTSSVDPFGLQQQGDANQLTFGEIGSQAINSLRDFSAPRGLADAKASINAACHRGNSCAAGDGSRATAPGDRAAWANILNANGGTDHSGGANLMCVFTQNCTQVHRCTVCRDGRPVQVERPNPLPPVGMVTLGDPPNARTIYFYNDPLQGWGNAADRRSGCLPPRHRRRRRTH